MDGFVHLHVHSHYSLLDGANRIGELVDTAKGFGMSSLALTDHGNLFGAVDFYATARKAGIKPILGLEAYISPTTRQDRSMGNAHDACYHLILLAMNQTGWRNLIRLSTRSYREGFYYKPRVDRELLSELNEGLICTTACLGGEVPSALLAGQQDKARRIAGEYRDIFGPERFFIEVQHQGLEDQDRVNPGLIALAGELGVGIVGTNDVHFLRREDKKAHEVLTAISTGKTLADGGALIYSPELYLKSPAEMREALRHWPESADNTLRIAEMCNVEVDFSAKHLPKFPTPNGEKPGEYLGKLAWDGLARRMAGGEIPEAYRKRLEWELKVIEDKGYSSYFLIVNDFVQYARRNNIPAAPRGSGVATLLGYALGVADVDPLRYGLLFERFTDPARKEDPDIDIDICQEGRGKVIQYVREKYGHVAQIITYGTLKPRAVLRDVGRVMGLPLIEVDAICKKVPEGPKVTMDKALDEEPELRKLYESQPQVREMVDYGKRLEGLARHSGVHAAGVIVCDKPLEGLVPLCTQSDSDELITQWDGPTCEKIGLMKMDFLGLRTLTTIQRARDLVRAASGKDIDPELLPLDDPKVFELFCKGETDGIFQFESGGMKDILMKMQPGRIEELIAANAMYRPGPMELIPSYIARKNGTEHIERVHELVDDILAETYGIMAYQEQVMQVLNRLGKLPLNRALTLIKAISKKKKEVINSERPNFVTGAEQNGIAPAESEQLFELILKFAGYGFNKAHSTRYAIVAYQTAYFKAYWPREFLAALLTFESSDTDKVVQYMNEAKRMGIRVAPPDINACDADFTVDGDRVRFGLAAVKGVGDKAVEAILTARREAKRFKDLFHFCRQVDLRAVNRATIEALVKCGAFDALGASRAAMTAALDSAIELGQTAASDRRSGQLSFFGDGGGLAADEAATPRFPDVEPWSESQMLKAEKETLGFFVSSHPLVEHGRELTDLSTPQGVGLARLEEYDEATPVTIGCMISEVRNTTTKTGRSAGKRMAMLTVEDLTGKADAVVFSDTYEKFGPFVQKEAIVFLRGTVDRRRERPSIIVDEIIPIEQALPEMTGRLLVRLAPSADPTDVLTGMKEVLARHHGDCPLFIELTPISRAEVRVVVRPDRAWFVRPDQSLLKELAAIVTDEALVLRPKQPNGNARPNRFARKPAPAGGRQPAMFNGGAAPGAAQGADAPVSAAVTRFN
jgi:DNA polymerase III subunit alpha